MSGHVDFAPIQSKPIVGHCLLIVAKLDEGLVVRRVRAEGQLTVVLTLDDNSREIERCVLSAESVGSNDVGDSLPDRELGDFAPIQSKPIVGHCLLIVAKLDEGLVVRRVRAEGQLTVVLTLDDNSREIERCVLGAESVGSNDVGNSLPDLEVRGDCGDCGDCAPIQSKPIVGHCLLVEAKPDEGLVVHRVRAEGQLIVELTLDDNSREIERCVLGVESVGSNDVGNSLPDLEVDSVLHSLYTFSVTNFVLSLKRLLRNDMSFLNLEPL